MDLSAAFHNLYVARRATNAAVCAVVKANAYGHGMPIAKLIEEKADMFAVATSKEADELLSLGIKKDVLILGAADEILNAKNVIYTAYDRISAAKLTAAKKRIALKANTGMNRLGFAPDTAYRAACSIKKSGASLHSIFTHFYDSANSEETEKQFEIFRNATDDTGALRHCCASGFLWLDKKYHLDIVRMGIALYGYPSGLGLKPVMRLYTEVVDLREVKKGEHIGYGNYVAKRDMRVATLRAGYGDGYTRLAQRKRYVWINGNRFPIAGQICMDMCMADVTGSKVKRGDRAYLIGGVVTAEDLAKSMNSISYEALTLLSARAERIYVEG